MIALDWVELKRWGFGALKLKPSEFWDLTLVEFHDLLDAYIHEERRQDDVKNQRTSWQTAHLMNATGNYKKRIKAEDLYKPMNYVEDEVVEQKIVKRFNSPEDKEKYLQDLMAKFKKN